MWNFVTRSARTIFNKTQEDILSAAFVIAASVVIAKLLSLVRYRLLAAFFGTHIQVLDGYFAATTLTDSVFETFIFGSIALAFIPVFSKYLEKEKVHQAWKLASTLITLSFICFLIFAAIFFFFSNQVASIIAPGLVAKFPETRNEISRLLQIIVVSQSILVMSIFISGALNSFKRFVVPALASIFYNIGIIISIVFLSSSLGIYAAAVGMILGALLHLLIQLPLLKSIEFNFLPNINFKNEDVKEVLTLMWPRSITIGLTNLSGVINVALASVSTVGSIVALNFAQVLQIGPTSLFAASLAQAAFVFLSIDANKGQKEKFNGLFIESLHQILFLVLPTAAILAVLRVPVVRLIFGARDLPWDTTVLAARTLLAFSVGIAAASVELLLIRGFHALRDSYTPVKIAVATTVLDIVMAVTFVLVLKLSIIFLAIASSIDSILTAAIMLYFLDRKVGGFDRKKLLVPIFKMTVISFTTAVALYIPMKLLDQLVFDTTHTVGLIILTTITATIGLGVYLLFSWIFGVEQLVIFTKFAKRVISFPSRLRTPEPESISA